MVCFDFFIFPVIKYDNIPASSENMMGLDALVSVRLLSLRHAVYASEKRVSQLSSEEENAGIQKRTPESINIACLFNMTAPR